jgi:hypothetical protein
MSDQLLVLQASDDDAGSDALLPRELSNRDFREELPVREGGVGGGGNEQVSRESIRLCLNIGEVAAVLVDEDGLLAVQQDVPDQSERLRISS